MKAHELERPVLSVDVVVFSIFEGRIHVFTSPRTREPFLNAPALPGVAIRIDETLMNAAKRALEEKGRGLIGDKKFHIEQLSTFDGIYRDPRGRTISVAYMGILPDFPEEKKDRWMPAFDIRKGDLPFDHDEIVLAAVERLQGKLRYTNIARAFLPETFRIEEIQMVYEAILLRPLNRTNFRNKLLKIEMIEQVSILNEAVGKKGGRPPHVYRFTGTGVAAAGRDFL